MSFYSLISEIIGVFLPIKRTWLQKGLPIIWLIETARKG